MATPTPPPPAPAILEARALALAENTPAQLEEHARVTQGKVRTRFPPEPNGYLHVGHAKSMHMNFFEAFEKLGVPEHQRETIFRYDDTNPEAESDEYINAIAETIAWLGYTPTRVTYSSDYFPQLYELAIQLIQSGHAYVCHQTKQEIEASRLVLQQFHASPGRKTEADVPSSAASPFRTRSVADNLHAFEQMRVGLFAEGAACLRMKQDLASPNPNMWDHVAYRIKFVPHPHVGSTWCIYPTYDYTHCIVDALEHIDYSICTLEFETRRESYYWLLDVLGLYKPKVYEFARLAMTFTVLSKRKLLKLVNSKTVRGWDDPRMATLNGLRRRGFTPAILKTFCKDIGVTRVQSTIQIERLFAVARAALGDSSKRVLAVLEPVECEILNFADAVAANLPLEFTVRDYPHDATRDGTHALALTSTIYVDRSDVRAVDEAGFYGIAPEKTVRLKYAYNFVCTAVHVDPVTNAIQKIDGNLVLDASAKPPKGVLSWVPRDAPTVEVRVYSHLFTVPELPAGVVDWEAYVDARRSEVVYANARIDPSSLAHNVKRDEAVQFERIGYFVLDQDTTATKTVLNQIIPLREASSLASAGSFTDKSIATGEATSTATTSRKDAQAQQLALKLEKMKIAPCDMFRLQTDLFSAFDDATGLPTHDAAGGVLAKSALKKLKKDQEKQKKLHDAYLAQQRK